MLIKNDGGNIASNEARELKIAGYVKGREIYLPPSSMINLVANASHEAGHIIGDELSFQGRNGKDQEVITFKELKASSPFILLTDEEIEYLTCNLNKQNAVLEENTISIIKKLLAVFTKGNFDTESIHFNNISQEELNKSIASSKVNTVEAIGEEDMHFRAVSSREGRNEEVPPMVCQVICMEIFQNILQNYCLLEDYQTISSPDFPSSSHQRAYKIVEEAYSRGWVLPSSFDMKLD